MEMSRKNRKIWQISLILAGQVLALATMIFTASLGVKGFPNGDMAEATPVLEEVHDTEATPADPADSDTDDQRVSKKSRSGLSLDLSISSPLG
jgi:hypothetical protein